MDVLTSLLNSVSGIFATPLILVVATLVVFGLFLKLKPARFTAKAVLNKTEQRLYGVLVSVVGEMMPHAKVLCQVSYGEFLRSNNRKAFWSINARRADFLIVDDVFAPFAVIEYQGHGHSGSSRRSARAARQGDRIKERACRSAGVAWIEIPARFTVADVSNTLEAALNPRVREQESRQDEQ